MLFRSISTALSPNKKDSKAGRGKSATPGRRRNPKRDAAIATEPETRPQLSDNSRDSPDAAASMGSKTRRPRSSSQGNVTHGGQSGITAGSHDVSSQSTGSNPSHVQPTQLTQSFIEKYYDQHGGNWTLGSKIWKDSAFSANKTVVDVEGIGNCFYETLKAGGIAINIPSRRAPTFRDYKAAILKYFESEEFQRNLTNPEFIRTFPALAGYEQVWTSQEIRRKLSTDGEYADEVLMQIAALALKIDITIENISSPGNKLAFLKGTFLPTPSIVHHHILLREDGVHHIYDEDFNPVRDEEGTFAMSSGHFWLVLDQPPGMQLRTLSGNADRSELDRPKTHEHGNQSHLKDQAVDARANPKIGRAHV